MKLSFSDLWDDYCVAMYHNFIVGLASSEINSRFSHLSGDMGLLPDSVRLSVEYRELKSIFDSRNRISREINSKLVKDKRFKALRKNFDRGDIIRLIRIDKRLSRRYFDGEVNLIKYENYIREFEIIMNDESFK